MKALMYKLGINLDKYSNIDVINDQRNLRERTHHFIDGIIETAH